MKLDEEDYNTMAEMVEPGDIDIMYEKGEEVINIIGSLGIFWSYYQHDYDSEPERDVEEIDLEIRYVKTYEGDSDFDDRRLYNAICDMYNYNYKVAV
jgi:hypothetical protein